MGYTERRHWMLLLKWVITVTEIVGGDVLKDRAEGWENMEFNHKFDISRKIRVEFEVENWNMTNLQILQEM